MVKALQATGSRLNDRTVAPSNLLWRCIRNRLVCNKLVGNAMGFVMNLMKSRDLANAYTRDSRWLVSIVMSWGTTQ